MAQLIVRNLEVAVKQRLQRRAARNGRSMEQEVREILRSVAKEEISPSGGLGTTIAKRFKRIGLSNDIVEFRGYSIQPATFEP
jgi:plasmid stability protein